MSSTASYNRTYKDSIFVDLFSTDEKAKERFLSLYNALHRNELHDISLLENIKLDHVMYMSFANDVSYLVENKIIVLAEHQSTINPNMRYAVLSTLAVCMKNSLNQKKNIHGSF